MFVGLIKDLQTFEIKSESFSEQFELDPQVESKLGKIIIFG